MTEQPPPNSAPPATPLPVPSPAKTVSRRLYLVTIVILLVGLAASSGTAVYIYQLKTAQVNDQVQRAVDLTSHNSNLQNQINQLQSQVSQLQSEVSQLQSQLASKPSYTLVSGTASVSGVSFAYGTAIFATQGTGSVQTSFFYNSTNSADNLYGPIYLQSGTTYSISMFYITSSSSYPYITNGKCTAQPAVFTPSGSEMTQNFFC